MKGLHGLILAVGLGVAAALFNFTYLANKSRDVETVSFVGVKPNATVNKGDGLKEDHLDEVRLPSVAKGNLEDYAILWAARSTVIGQKVNRNLIGGSLLLRQDLRIPPKELNLGQDERAFAVPIDPRRGAIPALINPGNMVTFIAPSYAAASPRLAPRAKPKPAGDAAEGSEKLEPVPEVAPVPGAAGGIDYIGPFRVLSVGNRLTTPDVMQSNRTPQTQENVITILVKLENGKPVAEAERLIRLVQLSDAHPLGVLLELPAKSE